MKNDWRERDGLVEIVLNRIKGPDVVTIIEASDFELVDSFPNKWSPLYNRKTDNFYVIGQRRNKWFYLHRWITKPPKGLVVDHMNRDTLDNRRSNLRVVTIAQNNQNLRLEGRRDRPGVRGVTWHKAAGKWMAQCQVGDDYRYLGLFEDMEDAHRAVSAARAEMMPFSEIDRDGGISNVS